MVALGEMGDKTQLLAMLLAVKFRKPLPIVCGIFVATLANHLTAGWVGAWVAAAIGPHNLRWVLGLSFLAMAAWVLVPDKLDAEEGKTARRYGAFGTTVVSFFLAEMGDKTQIATVALAARYQDLFQVIAGSTLGIMLVDAPAVFIGDRLARRLSMVWMHRIAAAIFAVLGLLALFNVGEVF